MAIRKDIEGKRFGKLIVIGPGPRRNNQSMCWVRCECGQEKLVHQSNLKAIGGTRSCGCAQKVGARAAMAAIRERQRASLDTSLAGERFGYCTVLEFIEMRNGTAYWSARCDCGMTFTARGSAMKYGQIKGCGCRRGNPLSSGTSMRNQLILTYRLSAERRGHDFSISDALFESLTQSDCHYCGSGPSSKKEQGGARGAYLYNGIDRIDNSRGYESDNVVTCCRRCNFSKGKSSYGEFQAYLNRIANFILEKSAITSPYRSVASNVDFKDSQCPDIGCNIHYGMAEDAGQAGLPG